MTSALLSRIACPTLLGSSWTTLTLSLRVRLGDIVVAEHRDLLRADAVLPEDRASADRDCAASGRPPPRAGRPAARASRPAWPPSTLPWRPCPSRLWPAPLALGTMKTTTFLRRIGDSGRSSASRRRGAPRQNRSRSCPARSLPPAGPAPRRRRSRILRRSRANCAANAWMIRASSLFWGPTAIFNSVGCAETVIGQRRDAATQQRDRRDDQPGVLHHQPETAALSVARSVGVEHGGRRIGGSEQTAQSRLHLATLSRSGGRPSTNPIAGRRGKPRFLNPRQMLSRTISFKVRMERPKGRGAETEALLVRDLGWRAWGFGATMAETVKTRDEGMAQKLTGPGRADALGKLKGWS